MSINRNGNGHNQDGHMKIAKSSGRSSERRPGLPQRLSAAYRAFLNPRRLARPANDDCCDSRQIEIDPMFLTTEMPAITDLIGLSFLPFDRDDYRSPD
ncbi:hypothetical protein [uncultured Ferrovibrio sp.]|jgi:hypothetical protein|uniref:hypothetical protein n=1 Tax=uncultured Ferrovibrio sp. TaxID=1576913 RepID=UPI0026175F43|nr:hypothetical protein [uncultured Ferrovibrio sp.]